MPANERPHQPENELWYRFGEPCIFDGVRQSAATVAGLHKIAERARKLDGRELNSPRRDDIRAAAKPLRRFWVEILARKEKLYQCDNVYQENIQFLCDCLLLIDKTVTRRMLVGLND